MAAQTNINGLLTTLLTAPGDAVTGAEQRYRRIWAQWLTDLLAMAEALKDSPGFNLAEFLNRQLEQLAPVMQLNGRIEVAATMRIASVSQTEAGGSLTLGVGPIGLSGNYGFMQRTSEESVLQVHAQYTLSNGETSLAQYLGSANLKVTSAAEVKKAIAFLETGAKA